MNDYVKSYIGEDKPAKKFAQEYLERRSRYRNSIKAKSRHHEDDLLTPAAAINPNDDFEGIGSGANGQGGGFQQVGPGGRSAQGQGGKNAKKKGKKDKKTADASHLLGFSVSSNRVNAGELDFA